MKLPHRSRIFWIPILVALLFDLLFWKKAPGISFFVLVLLLMAAGWWLGKSEGIVPAKTTYILVPLVIGFSAMTFIRAEQFTTTLNAALTIGLLSLIAITYTGGKWWNYSFSDYVVKTFQGALSTISRLLIFLVEKPTPSVDADSPDETTPGNTSKKPHQTWSVVRGVLISIPIVLLLGAILAAADPIFGKQFEEILKIFKIDRLGEYIFRLFYILVLGSMLAGAYLHAYTQSKDARLLGVDKPWLPPFMGWIEAVILLAAIDILFGIFVGIQFRYFFGGYVTIEVSGITYSEYARKGFGELVGVAVISLLILQTLNTIVKRSTKNQAHTFSIFGVGLVGLVIVILVSSFQRLMLYEAAYGFSRLRTYSHVFIIWLGILLIGTAMIEIIRKQRLFARVLLICIVGFGISINLINMDKFIASSNISLSMKGRPLDAPYLLSLSDDAIPLLSSVYQSESWPQDVRSKVGAVLACKRHNLKLQDENASESGQTQFWGSYHWSRTNARAILNSLGSKLDDTNVIISASDYGDYSMAGEDEVYCYSYSGWD